MNKYRVKYKYKDDVSSYHSTIVASSLEDVKDEFYKFYPTYCEVLDIERVYGDVMDLEWGDNYV